MAAIPTKRNRWGFVSRGSAKVYLSVCDIQTNPPEKLSTPVCWGRPLLPKDHRKHRVSEHLCFYKQKALSFQTGWSPHLLVHTFPMTRIKSASATRKFLLFLVVVRFVWTYHCEVSYTRFTQWKKVIFLVNKPDPPRTVHPLPLHPKHITVSDGMGIHVMNLNWSTAGRNTHTHTYIGLHIATQTDTHQPHSHTPAPLSHTHMHIHYTQAHTTDIQTYIHTPHVPTHIHRGHIHIHTHTHITTFIKESDARTNWDLPYASSWYELLLIWRPTGFSWQKKTNATCFIKHRKGPKIHGEFCVQKLKCFYSHEQQYVTIKWLNSHN